MARLTAERWNEGRLVRGALRHRSAQASDGEGRAFEERITLWRAASFDEAIERAGIEAAEYASSLSGASATELLQAYRLPAEPSDGAEIFSLIRMSQLRPDPYLSAFFDTGPSSSRPST